MAFDPTLAQRIRTVMNTYKGVAEKHMFGGIAFLVHGNMCCGVLDDLLVVRLDGDDGDAALDEPHTRPMDFTGRTMRGWIYVEPEGHRDDGDLGRWIERAYHYASSLPAKKGTR